MNCGHENKDTLIVCQDCGALRDYEGESRDNTQDPADLFLEGEGI